MKNLFDIFIRNVSLFRSKVLSEDILVVPLKNSSIGLFSQTTTEVEQELDPKKLPECETKQLGSLMALKPLTQDQKLILAAYENGDIALWDLKMKSILSWLKIESCPFTIDYDETLKLGVIGNPTDKLEVCFF